MEEKKQHEELEEKTILDAQEVETAVSRLSEEAKNHPESTVDIEEVERIASAFKGVNSDSAIMSMAIIASVLEGHEIMLLISIFKKALSLAMAKTLTKMFDKKENV